MCNHLATRTTSDDHSATSLGFFARFDDYDLLDISDIVTRLLTTFLVPFFSIVSFLINALIANGITAIKSENKLSMYKFLWLNVVFSCAF